MVGHPDPARPLGQHKSPEQSASDLTQLMQHDRQKWGIKRFVLTGYSFGADVWPAIYNLPATEQQRVDAVILLAFARSGSFEIDVDGWLGKAGMETDTGPDMAKLPADKVLRIDGVEEVDESGCTTKTAVGEATKLPGGITSTRTTRPWPSAWSRRSRNARATEAPCPNKPRCHKATGGFRTRGLDPATST